MVVFDVLVNDGIDVRQLSYRDRRIILKGLILPPGMLRSESFDRDDANHGDLR